MYGYGYSGLWSILCTDGDCQQHCVAMGRPAYDVWFGSRMQAARDSLPCTMSTPLTGNTAGEATPQKRIKIMLDLQRPTPTTATILEQGSKVSQTLVDRS